MLQAMWANKLITIPLKGDLIEDVSVARFARTCSDGISQRAIKKILFRSGLVSDTQKNREKQYKKTSSLLNGYHLSYIFANRISKHASKISQIWNEWDVAMTEEQQRATDKGNTDRPQGLL